MKEHAFASALQPIKSLKMTIISKKNLTAKTVIRINNTKVKVNNATTSTTLKMAAKKSFKMDLHVLNVSHKDFYVIIAQEKLKIACMFCVSEKIL